MKENEHYDHKPSEAKDPLVVLRGQLPESVQSYLVASEIAGSGDWYSEETKKVASDTALGILSNLDDFEKDELIKWTDFVNQKLRET